MLSQAALGTAATRMMSGIWVHEAVRQHDAALNCPGRQAGHGGHLSECCGLQQHTSMLRGFASVPGLQLHLSGLATRQYEWVNTSLISIR